jgi:hypothetical protein
MFQTLSYGMPACCNAADHLLRQSMQCERCECSARRPICLNAGTGLYVQMDM